MDKKLSFSIVNGPKCNELIKIFKDKEIAKNILFEITASGKTIEIRLDINLLMYHPHRKNRLMFKAHLSKSTTESFNTFIAPKTPETLYSATFNGIYSKNRKGSLTIE